jgi:hypothetical protein
VIIWREGYNSVEVVIDLPVSSYVLLEGSEDLEERITSSFKIIGKGRILDGNGNSQDSFQYLLGSN